LWSNPFSIAKENQNKTFQIELTKPNDPEIKEKESHGAWYDTED
jgi:hypothetical protein